jgi:hypothetical protein
MLDSTSLIDDAMPSFYLRQDTIFVVWQTGMSISPRNRCGIDPIAMRILKIMRTQTKI